MVTARKNVNPLHNCRLPSPGDAPKCAWVVGSIWLQKSLDQKQQERRHGIESEERLIVVAEARV